MKATMTTTSLSLLCLLGLSTAGLAGPNGRVVDTAEPAAGRGVSSGSCTDMTAMDVKSDSSTDASTNASSFVDVPNSWISFTQGGSGSGCVVVTFTGESWAPRGRVLQLQARLDSATTGAPGNVQLSGDDDEDGDGEWSRSHAFTFVFPSVKAGPHYLVVRYRSVTSGNRVYMGKHTTVVQHR
jgi:hypothetical protein